MRTSQTVQLHPRKKDTGIYSVTIRKQCITDVRVSGRLSMSYSEQLAKHAAP